MADFDLTEEVKDKLEEAVVAWANEYLAGKPALLANGVYLNLLELLKTKTVEINETFKD